MAIKTITSFGTLMKLASTLGKAKQNGDEEEIKKAQKAHDDYKKLCLESDEMSTGYTYGSLYGR